MSKYPWANNQQKLQRAIERANIEQQPIEKKEARVKELYVSFGGKLVELTADNQNKDMPENEAETPEVVAPESGTEEVAA